MLPSFEQMRSWKLAMATVGDCQWYDVGAKSTQEDW